MARRSENASKTVEDLNKQIRALKVDNRPLSQKLLTLQNTKRQAEELLQTAILRSQKHLCAVKKLKRTRFFIYTGQFLSLICSVGLMFHIGIYHIKRNKEADAMWQSYFGQVLYSLDDTRNGSIAIGAMGLIISIVGQLIFPAPWRSFLAVAVLAIKQMIDVFLPVWCTVLLPIFVFIALFTINLDRLKQVCIIILLYEMP
jgi:hypothetical protein